MRTLKVAGGLALLTLGATLPAAAQEVTVGVDAAGFSSYVWRGLTFSSKPVLEPDVWISAYGFTAGAWANMDLSKCDSTGNSLCEAGPTRTGIAEIDYWVEYGRSFGNVSAKAGWVAYTFNKNNVGGVDTAFNTSEVYASLSLGGMSVTPSVGVWYDINNVKGLYLQPQLSYGLKAGTQTINLTALAGISAGQEVNKDTTKGEGSNFAKSGLTHIDFSASTSFTAGPISIAPSFHFQISHDPAVSVNNATDYANYTATGNKQSSSKFWGGVTLSWSHSLGASTATE